VVVGTFASSVTDGLDRVPDLTGVRLRTPGRG